MGLTKERNSDNYLDLANMNFRDDAEAIAYMVDARPGNTRDIGAGYIAFFIKELGGSLVRGWMFNPENFESQGLTLAAIKRKPVRLKFKAQVRGGSVSLIVKEVKLFDGVFDFGKFLGTIESAKEDLDKVNDYMEKFGWGDYKLPSKLATSDFVEICEARVGGYAKLSWSVLRNLANYFYHPSVNEKEILLVAARALTIYAKYLETYSVLDITLKHQLVKLVSDYSEVNDARLNTLIADVGFALVGLGKPEHLYSHLIYDTIKKVEKDLRLAYSYSTMMDGSVKSEGSEFKLAKY